MTLFLTSPRGWVLEGKPTAGEGSRVRNFLPLPLHHIGFDELVPEVRGLHVQARGVSGCVVLLIMALNHLYLNCLSDSAGRDPHGPPTFYAARGSPALGIFSGDLLGKILPNISRSLIGPRSSPRREWRMMARRWAHLRL